MEIDDLDFRHIRLLDALLRKRSVSGAARHLDIPQPTASHGLARLRDALNDRLLVRVRGGMEPTPKARAIAKEVDQLLRLRQRLVEGGLDFDSTALDREFVIAASDIGQLMALSTLYEVLHPEAPGVRFRGTTLDADEMRRALESGEADLVLGPYPELVAGIHAQSLYEERYRCFARPDHPYVKSGTEADFLDAHHVVASTRGLAHAHRVAERALIETIDPAHRYIITGSFLVALLTARRTNLIVTLPGRILEPLARELGLVCAEPPFELAGFDVKQYWHARNHQDPAHRWLRQSLYRALDGAIAPRPAMPSHGVVALKT
ncbi:MAG: LysR family transcriptional regulator [Gammaproteobacteria bacterium]|nr:LysR family transcriptional regulator [Gammaproteobacteria bacterium]MXY06048.1 LysR family transcriptional regulator [Gammaproteobacteria bacterium]MYE50554.1 LysR family transcriptional regulator [Gammaproteobacteria bacterium]MYF50298.1 LysR family transcriptional regulator [Gammaproteobacteria bacterium]MYG13823.1 LysR family transcriptional regulator [Gammaproteobacteria bacterium]